MHWYITLKVIHKKWVTRLIGTLRYDTQATYLEIHFAKELITTTVGLWYQEGGIYTPKLRA